MENAIMNCPKEQPVIRPDDPEVFQRVWKRVMPEGENCPIVVETTTVGGDLPCACACPRPAEGEAWAREGQTEQVGQAPQEARPLPTALGETDCPHRGNDFPDLSDVQRLGPSSSVYGSLLQRQVADALEAWQLYRCLARRSPGRGGRMLTAAASEKHHAARRLAAAYFLISGLRFWPVDRVSVPRIPSYLGAIRQGYQAEQQREQAYLMAVGDTGDEALQELFQDLASQSAEHSALLRSLLEQSSL